MRILRRRFVKLPQYVPVLLILGEAAGDGWGRLLHLSARGFTLLTRFDLKRGSEVFLTFELAGTEFEAVACRVTRREIDRDGYCLYGLEILRDGEIQKMQQKLMELLTKQTG